MIDVKKPLLSSDKEDKTRRTYFPQSYRKIKSLKRLSPYVEMNR